MILKREGAERTLFVESHPDGRTTLTHSPAEEPEQDDRDAIIMLDMEELRWLTVSALPAVVAFHLDHGVHP